MSDPMRKLKFHEKKLLSKVDFLNWKTDDNIRESEIVRRYHLSNREEYLKYSKICGQVHSLVSKMKVLDPADPFRIKMTEMLLSKLYNMGLINDDNSLLLADKLTVSSFCRRRLPVVMVKIKMAENLKKAVEYVQNGHVRVGPHSVNDPAYLVTRHLEDFVTWVDNSKIKQTIDKYNDRYDDYNF